MTDRSGEEESQAQERAVTGRIERDEFERGHIAADQTPAPPRDAATIVLARELREPGFEVLLLRRPPTARFAAGAYVFPGGKVDAGDADEEFESRMPKTGRDAEPEALLAALRELFEETGLLLADSRPGAADLERERTRLLAGDATFGGVAREHNLSFTSTRVCYFARWITPARFSRRYDTRFFLAELPSDLRHFQPQLTDEIVDYTWVTPAHAVRMFRNGRLPMLFPTRVTLQALSEFGAIEQVFTRYSTQRVEPVTPRLLIRGNSIRPVLPGQPGYDEADG